MNKLTTTDIAKSSIRPVVITVNRKPVKIQGPKVKGQKIKLAAIEQGVNIQLDFQLAMIGKDGKHHIVGDDDIIEVTKGLEFFATASDDNS
ncbi:MAG: multiubiquitin domain-containing protein [Acidimicrobiaceae bacterium]|nr:multiubiquitin domain-containing protein [Acidimicrobiaceae bacterium]